MAGHGFVEAVLGPQHIAEIGMELGQVGPALDGRAKDRFGLI